MKKGISLIVLVITIIVLIILASVGVITLTGQNGVINKAQNATEEAEIKQIEERINLAYMNALLDGNGDVTESSLETELKAIFNKSTLEEGWLDKEAVQGKWRIIIEDVYLDVPAGNGSNSVGLKEFTWLGEWGDEDPIMYQFEDGMTWAEWIDSEYNTDPEYITLHSSQDAENGGRLYADGWLMCHDDSVDEWAAPVYGNDLIHTEAEGWTYYYLMD